MSEISGCRWYNPCSWFSRCMGDQEENEETHYLRADDQECYKTPESQKRSVITPGNTPTKSPTIKGEKVDTEHQWD